MTAKRRAERAEVFIAPAEIAAPTVEEKRHKKRKNPEVVADGDAREGGEKVRKKKQKKREGVVAEP
jgi:ribosomal RNA assembly protein